MPFTAIYLPLYDILKRRFENKPLQMPTIAFPTVGSKGMSVSGGAQARDGGFPIFGQNNQDGLRMRMNRNYLKQHPLEGRTSFISF